MVMKRFSNKVGITAATAIIGFRRIGPLLVAASVVILAAGCSKSTGGVAVKGHISYRGEPLSNTSIIFFPPGGRSVAAAVTDGDYSLNLAPGDYTVIVIVGADVPKGYKEGDPLPPPKFTLPPEYTVQTKSTLKATVTAGQTDPINFDLK
jgi:hypothetical protein